MTGSPCAGGKAVLQRRRASEGARAARAQGQATRDQTSRSGQGAPPPQTAPEQVAAGTAKASLRQEAVADTWERGGRGSLARHAGLGYALQVNKDTQGSTFEIPSDKLGNQRVQCNAVQCSAV
jgi:hypothetical protein